MHKTKGGNGSSLLPFIEYKSHVKHMEHIKAPTDTGISSPEKSALMATKKIRHELTQILEKKRK